MNIMEALVRKDRKGTETELPMPRRATGRSRSAMGLVYKLFTTLSGLDRGYRVSLSFPFIISFFFSQSVVCHYLTCRNWRHGI